MIIVQEVNTSNTQLSRALKNLEEIVELIRKTKNSSASDEIKLLSLKNIPSLLITQAQIIKKIIERIQ
jgi:hypothetical protein